MTTRRIVIAGGGIGGLAAALGLSQRGFAVLVLEKGHAFAEIGAGIQLGPNAFHSFDYLGVGDAARKMAVYIDRLRLMDAIKGDEICHIPLDEPFRQRFRNPYAVVHRGDLYRVFLDACRANPQVELRANTEVVSYQQDANSVTVMLASRGSTVANCQILRTRSSGSVTRSSAWPSR